ncbi:MAG: NAD(P)-dependent oxidoreductase [Actinomycetota bacterium]|nr:NAD(P)-dependent oxidoreductase [Actinomycetota bacterium]
MTERIALVTGATGFIATHLLPALSASGWHVRVSGRRPRPDDLSPDIDYQPADLAGDDDLGPLLEGVTHVFHLAGASSSRSDEEEMLRTNVGGTERLLEAVSKAGTVERFLHMSTTAIYGEEVQLPSPVPEDVEPHPSRGYGKAKWGAEQAVWRASENGMPVVVLRPVSVHGPGATKLLASAILDVAIERFAGHDRLPVPAEPIEQRLLHVEDLVGASLHLIDHEEAVGRAFNVVSGVYPTSHDVAGLLADAFGMTVELDDDPDCGPSYDERKQTWERMLDEGMRDDIIFTKERFRFMRKANRNNQLSIEALLGTGFRLQHADLAQEVPADIAWYREHRWILGP